MTDIGTHLRMLEDQLLQSALRHDRQFVSALLADEFRECGSSGRVWNKEELVSALDNESTPQFSIANFEAAILSPDIVLVTYRAAHHCACTGESTASLRSFLWVDGMDDANSVSSRGCEYLLTWNFRHIANAMLEPVLYKIVNSYGYQPSIISTPEQLLAGYGDL